MQFIYFLHKLFPGQITNALDFQTLHQSLLFLRRLLLLLWHSSLDGIGCLTLCDFMLPSFSQSLAIFLRSLLQFLSSSPSVVSALNRWRLVLSYCNVFLRCRSLHPGFSRQLVRRRGSLGSGWHYDASRSGRRHDHFTTRHCRHFFRIPLLLHSFPPRQLHLILGTFNSRHHVNNNCTMFTKKKKQQKLWNKTSMKAASPSLWSLAAVVKNSEERLDAEVDAVGPCWLGDKCSTIYC